MVDPKMESGTVRDELRDALLMANRCGRLRIGGQRTHLPTVHTMEQVECELDYRLRQYQLSEVEQLHPHDIPTGLKRMLSLAIAVAL